MELTETHRARLYALTAVACVIWLVQSLMEAHGDGSLFTWPTVVFSLCLAVVIVYTSYSAIKGWSANDDGADTGNDDADVAVGTDEIKTH